MDTSEELSPIEQEANLIQNAQEEALKEYISLPPKERATSDISEKTLIKLQEKIQRVRLRKLKKGVKI